MVATTLSQTKFYAPKLRSGIIQRHRLVEKLNDGLLGTDGLFNRKLSLISAPAGFGKTTLVIEWLHSMRPVQVQRAVSGTKMPAADAIKGPGRRLESGIEVAWLTCDSDDDDPIRFLTSVIRALQTVQPLRKEGFGEAALMILEAPAGPAGPPGTETALTMMIDDLAKVKPLVLVLDDYHVIQVAGVHKLVSTMLDFMPRQIHLVIVTREEPPISLDTIRAKQQLVELQATELQFGTDETTQLLRQEVGQEFSAEDVRALATRTEGWIAGLQLATLAMKGKKSIDSTIAFIRVFSGSHRYILDYLVAELLDQQPPEVQEFLIETAILGPLNGPLCDEVTGRTNSQEILTTLEKANLFTVSLDPYRHWFRFHSLFNDLLRARSMQLEGQNWAQRHRRAAAWYKNEGHMAEALEHWLHAGDIEAAADVVESNAMNLLKEGRVVTLLSWLDRFSVNAIRSRPWLTIYRSWALLLTGQIDRVHDCLEEAERLQPDVATSAETQDAWGQLAAIRTYLASLEGNGQETIKQSERALKLLSPNNHVVRSMVSFMLGEVQLASGDLSAAERAFKSAARSGRAAGNSHVAVAAFSSVAKVELAHGRLKRAEQTYKEAINLATTTDGQRLPNAALALNGLAQIAYEWNELAKAEEYLKEAGELNKRWANPDSQISAILTLIRVKRAKNDLSTAERLMTKARQVASEKMLSPDSSSNLAAQQMELYLDQGNIRAAARIATERHLAWDDPLNFHRLSEYVMLVRILYAQEAIDEAFSLLDRLVQASGEDKRQGDVISLRALLATMLLAEGEIQQAILTTTQTLYLAESEKFIRTFVDLGEPLRQILEQIAARHILPAYVNNILAVMSSGTGAPVAD